MLLGRSRGADAVYFRSELLVRCNELQNRQLHFDRKNVIRNAKFDFSISKRRRSAFILIKNLSISTNSVDFRVNVEIDRKNPNSLF